MTPPLVVAEIGCNHRGEVNTACRMIDVVAGYCREHFQLDGARPDVVVKFQKRTPSAYPDDYLRPHPNLAHAYGDSYGAHREALEFSAAEHDSLALNCRLRGVGYACSVWDEGALADIVTLGLARWLKIPSARNRDWDLIRQIYERWPGEVHISLGMVTRAEVGEIVEFIRDGWDRTVLYACTSGYPVEFKDVRLGEIEWLQRNMPVKSIGFSGHHHGIAVDMAAAAMGVSHIERHFTLNRTWKGTDHAASLEPDGLRKLIRDVGAVTRSLGLKGDGPLDVEIPQREKLTRTAVNV